MAEQTRFWDSFVGDTRQYTAAQFAAVLQRLLGQGVITDVDNELVVAESAPPALTVTVATGEAFIQGYWYRNTTLKIVTLDAAHATLNRIDRIVIQVDLTPGLTGRTIIATFHKGTPAATPVAPALTRTANTYEISLAQVYVAATVVSVTNANITDERYDNTLAGYTGGGISLLFDGALTTVAGTKAVMTTGRNYAAAGVIAGKVYVVGGVVGAAAVLDTNEMYDPVLNTWTSKLAMTTARAGLMAGVVGGLLYAIGGFTGSGAAPVASKKCEEYTPGTNLWAAKTDMTTARYYLAGDVVNLKIYCIGGTTGADFLQDNEEYTPATDTWADKLDMTTGRYGLACAQVSNIIYCIGGTVAGPASTDKNESYTPGTDTWATEAVMPAITSAHAAAAHGGYVYSFGTPAPAAITYKYDPVGDVWTTLDSSPTAHASPVAATVGNAIYLIGGSAGSQINEAFDAIPHYICQSAGPKLVTIIANSTLAHIIVDRGAGTYTTIEAADAQVPSSNATVRLYQWSATSIIVLIG